MRTEMHQENFWGEPLLESIGGFDDFETDKVPIDVYGNGQEWTTTTASKVTLKWSIDIESRKWGVKDLSIKVPDQKVVFTAEQDDADGNSIEKEIELEIKDVKIETKIPEDADLSTISIVPIQVDIYKERATVQFGV